MDFKSILALLSPFVAMIEPILLNLEQNQVQPELKKLIDGISSPDLKALLMALDKGLDEFIQLEIKKLG